MANTHPMNDASAIIPRYTWSKNIQLADLLASGAAAYIDVGTGAGDIPGPFNLIRVYNNTGQLARVHIGNDVTPLVGSGATAPTATPNGTNGMRAESISVPGGCTEFYCKGNRIGIVNAGSGSQATNKLEVEVFG